MHRAAGDAVGGMTGQHLGQRAFAAAITPHHRMDFTGTNLEVHPLQNGLVLHGCMQVGDVEKQLGVGADHRGANEDNKVERREER